MQPKLKLAPVAPVFEALSAQPFSRLTDLNIE